MDKAHVKKNMQAAKKGEKGPRSWYNRPQQAGGPDHGRRPRRSGMDCPVCKVPMHEILSAQGAVVDFCDRCKGTWLDGGEVASFAYQPTEALRKLSGKILNGGL